MRETATAARGATDESPTGTPARTAANVVQLEQYRAGRLDESAAGIRRRLSELQRARAQAELSAGHLLLELAALQRELRDCRAQMVKTGVALD